MPAYSTRNIVVIGASAGGVEALQTLLGSLPPKMPISFLVVLHLSPHSESHLPKILAQSGSLPAEHARDGATLLPCRIYVAPPDYHLMLDGNVLRLSHGPKENRHRPAIDALFRSAAESHGPKVVGVLLTGNLDDGVAGLRLIQRRGGLTIVQDPSEADFPEMPRNALAAFRPEHVLPLKQIEQLLKETGQSALSPNHGGGRMRNSKSEKSPGSQTPSPWSLVKDRQ